MIVSIIHISLQNFLENFFSIKNCDETLNITNLFPNLKYFRDHFLLLFKFKYMISFNYHDKNFKIDSLAYFLFYFIFYSYLKIISEIY